MKKLAFILFFIAASSCKKNQEVEVANFVEGTSIRTFNYAGLERYVESHPSETLVINFWATWCAPCIKELPAFEKITQKYAEQEVTVLLVSLDFPEEMDKLKKFIEKKELQSEVVYLDDGDANRWIPKVHKSWSGAIPATLIKTNKNKKFYEKSFSYAQLENEIANISN